MGASVASYMAAKEENLFRGMVLEGAWKSVPELLAEDKFPYFPSLHFLFVRIYWNVEKNIEDLNMPVQYFHG